MFKNLRNILAPNAAAAHAGPPATSAAFDLSIIVGIHNMPREAPRTIATLSRAYQRGVGQLRYEIIIADNGSSTPLDADTWSECGCDVRYLPFPPGNVSPARALNKAAAQARGRVICLMIDGARMVSPGILRHGMLACELAARAIGSTHGFHLGPDVQSRSVPNGYNQHAEDDLLRKSGWRADGYRLFDISVFAGSSHRGWFISPNESNCLFLRREFWHELGGLDERFISPGGGLVNLDLYKRACETPGAQLITILGEGSFHQVHGGATTGSAPAGEDPNAAMNAEYEQLRGHPFQVTSYPCTFIGAIPPSAAKHIAESARQLEQHLAAR